MYRCTVATLFFEHEKQAHISASTLVYVVVVCPEIGYCTNKESRRGKLILRKQGHGEKKCRFISKMFQNWYKVS